MRGVGGRWRGWVVITVTVTNLHSQFILVEKVVVSVGVGVYVRAPLVLPVDRVKPSTHLMRKGRVVG